jgi:hypothetical protein
MGLKIKSMENNDDYQDSVLSVHHACMNFFNVNKNAKKLIANNKKFFMQ